MPLAPITPDRLDFLDREPDGWLPHESWKVDDSSIEHYFDLAHLGGNPNVRQVIERQLGQFTTNVGLDIAGGTNAMALRDLMNVDLLSKGIVTNYPNECPSEAEADPRLIRVGGDLRAVPAWQGMLGAVLEHAPEGLSLIMHRPFGALQDLRPEFYGHATHLLLDLLRPGGVMFTQIPLALSFAHPEVKHEQCAAIRDRADVLEVQASRDRGLLATATIVKACEPLAS